METLELKATVRDLGKPVASARKQGFVPAELYGHNVPNVHLQVAQNEFEKVFRKAGESTIVSLDIEGVGKRSVLIHDVHAHVLKSHAIHVDFYEVNMKETLQTTVQLEFVGEAPAVKALGGVLVKTLTEVEVECLPSDLPHNLTVDISGMATFDDVIVVKDITLPKGVTMLSDAEEMVAKIQPPREAEADLSSPVVEDVTKVAGVVKEEEKSDAK
ncbi:MAG: 50S ribosomal protein L25 [Candidatus Doudnabacteria bacterium]|nr:50S ribosomal protein L25 [Candidatus Doudnabacteria bacterium]